MSIIVAYLLPGHSSHSPFIVTTSGLYRSPSHRATFAVILSIRASIRYCVLNCRRSVAQVKKSYSFLAPTAYPKQNNMSKVPSRRVASAPKGLLITCALSFIISSIPLAAVLFIYNPHIIKELDDASCVANENEIQAITEKYVKLLKERDIAMEEQRIQLVEHLKIFQVQNKELHQQLSDATKNFTIESYECTSKLARAQHGFEESYRRFEIVQGYFEKCKDQTLRLGKVLVEAEAEIANCTKKLTYCSLLNKKIESEALYNRSATTAHAS
jgi:hypothetical protein